MAASVREQVRAMDGRGSRARRHPAEVGRAVARAERVVAAAAPSATRGPGA
jgi:hypothetical protein